jgi:hypothetical protein
MDVLQLKVARLRVEEIKGGHKEQVGDHKDQARVRESERLIAFRPDRVIRAWSGRRRCVLTSVGRNGLLPVCKIPGTQHPPLLPVTSHPQTTSIILTWSAWLVKEEEG